MWIVFKYVNGKKVYISYDDNNNMQLVKDKNKAYHFNYFDYASLYLKQGYCIEKIY